MPTFRWKAAWTSIFEEAESEWRLWAEATGEVPPSEESVECARELCLCNRLFIYIEDFMGKTVLHQEVVPIHRESSGSTPLGHSAAQLIREQMLKEVQRRYSLSGHGLSGSGYSFMAFFTGVYMQPCPPDMPSAAVRLVGVSDSRPHNIPQVCLECHGWFVAHCAQGCCISPVR